MWIADKLVYRGEDDFIRAYQGGELVWEKSSSNNKIFYTSTDGQVITPRTDMYGWGANIVSNTYDEFGVIEFDGDVKRFPNQAFYNYQNLKSIVIPDSVIRLGEYALGTCHNLISVKIGSGVKNIWDCAFISCNNLKSIELPESVETIDANAFAGCGLTSIVIPGGIKTIGSGAFSNCKSLTSVVFSYGIVSIGKEAFRGCIKLVSVDIPDSVMRIGEQAFYCPPEYESSLTTVNIGNSVTNIGGSAFEYNRNLTSITINAVTPPVLGGNESFGGGVFDGSFADIRVPKESVDVYKTSPKWSYYADRIVSQ